MPRFRRVRWRLDGGTTAAAAAIKTAVDAALVGKPRERTPTASRRASAIAEGDCLFRSAVEADAVYAVLLAQLNQTAVAGMVQSEDCDHDVTGRSSSGGCTAVARAARGEEYT